MKNNHYETIEDKILKKEAKEKKKMRVSGKSVLKLQEIIKRKFQAPKSPEGMPKPPSGCLRHKYQINSNEQNPKQ